MSTQTKRTTIARVAAAVDSYPEGQDAAVLGAAIAAATGAEMMLLAIEPDLPLIIPGMQRKQLRQETESMLQRTRDSLAPEARLEIETDLSVARGLEKLVRAHNRDVLVVGSSRHAHDGHVRIGNRTRQLLDVLESAVAVAPRGLAHQTELSFKRIAVGFDGGAESRAALQTAVTLASGAGAQLLVRGIIDDRVPALGWPNVWMGAIMQSWQEMMDDEAESLRQEIATALQELGAVGEIELTRGRPAKSLLALSLEVDLLVIGSRRWGPLARLVLGGTGETLARAASCSLLVVPRPHQES